MDMPLLSSSLNFSQICNFYKLVIFQDAPFVISFVFGQTLELSIFAEICLFRLNLPFSYDHHLSRLPSLSPHLSICKPPMDFLPNPPFSQFANFVKSPTVNITGLHLTSREPNSIFIVLTPNMAALSRGCKP